MSIVEVIAGTAGTFGATAPSIGAMDYTYSVYSTWNGASQYSNGVVYIGFNGSSWVWSSAPNGGGTVYATNASSSTTIPTSGWSGSGNPTLAAITTGLTTSYTASGAGTTSANGTYLPISGANATYAGVTQYCNGTNYLSWSSNNWNVNPSVNTVGGSNLYSPGSSAGTTFPLTGWTTGTGTPPPLTFIGGGGGGSTDAPVYPYEQIINLQQYTLTSNGCINPQYAIDDIESTDAVFPAGVSVPTNTTRFLKVDWGYDAWITRIRINQSTTTSTSYAGINYESSYGLILNGQPAPQVPILAVTPIPEGNGVYSIYFTPPVLARGIEYYPDFNNPSLSSLPEVDLYQLQVYEDTVWQTGVSTNMPIQGPTPTVQFATVGIELLTIYPWVSGASYPFPSASAVPLYAIQGLDFDAKASLAIVRGGDSVHELGGYETHRETTGKFMVEQSDLRTFSIFLGDQVIIDAASGANGENQYATSLFSSQAPYFTIVGVSTHGDGTQDIVLPKVKITGLTRNIDTDKPTDLEVSFKPFFDKTYKLQSGGTGGLYEFVSNSGTSVLPPS